MVPEEHRKKMVERRQKSIEGRKKRQEYFKVKREVLEHEEDNNTKLYVVKAPDGWCKMLDNSAFIYAYEIAPRLKKEVTVYVDTDYNYPAKNGVVSIKAFDTLKKELRSVKVELVFDDERIAVFNLGRDVPFERINGFMKIDESLRQRIDKLLVPERIFPSLKQQLRELKETVWHTSQKMSEWNKQMVGYNMARAAKEVFDDFILMARGFKDADLFFSESQMKLERMKCDLLTVEEMKICNMEKIFQISRLISEAEKGLIKASSQLSEARQKRNEEKKAEKEGRRLAKQSETKKKVMERAENGTKSRASKAAKAGK